MASEKRKTSAKAEGVVQKSDNHDTCAVKTIECTLKSAVKYADGTISFVVTSELFPKRYTDILVKRRDVLKMPARGSKLNLTYFVGIPLAKKLTTRNGEIIFDLPEDKEGFISEW